MDQKDNEQGQFPNYQETRYNVPTNRVSSTPLPAKDQVTKGFHNTDIPTPRGKVSIVLDNNKTNKVCVLPLSESYKIRMCPNFIGYQVNKIARDCNGQNASDSQMKRINPFNKMASKSKESVV